MDTYPFFEKIKYSFANYPKTAWCSILSFLDKFTCLQRETSGLSVNDGFQWMLFWKVFAELTLFVIACISNRYLNMVLKVNFINTPCMPCRADAIRTFLPVFYPNPSPYSPDFFYTLLYIVIVQAGEGGEGLGDQLPCI